MSADCIGCVGINHEGNVAEMLTDGADELDIAARLDLDLDATVAGVQVGFDRLDQLDDAWGTDRRPNPIPPPARSGHRGPQQLGD